MSEHGKSLTNDNFVKNLPNCASQELVQCHDSQDFCVKSEYAWLLSVLYSEPKGHYSAKACTGPPENVCTESGYYLGSSQWITCCQSDGCNK